MSTEVIITSYSQSLEFCFNIDGQVTAICNQIKTTIQDPNTMDVIAGNINRSEMDLSEAKTIIANAQMQPTQD